MNNPYDAPAANLSAPRDNAATYIPAFFSLSGRLGRARYFAYLMGTMILVMAAMMVVVLVLMLLFKRSFALAPFLPLLGTIFMFGFSMLVMRRRLNDMNKTGWLSLLTFVPFVNLGLWLWLLFGPGDKELNNYGPPPCENSTGVTFACIFAAAATLLVIVVAATTDYSGVPGSTQPRAVKSPDKE